MDRICGGCGIHLDEQPDDRGGTMAKINKGRYSADVGADGKVLFIIGMRINRFWQVWRWLPVFVAMPRMLIELQKNRTLGLVG